MNSFGVLNSVQHYVGKIRTMRNEVRTQRFLNSLPADIRKDIGWPICMRVTAAFARSEAFYMTMLGCGPRNARIIDMDPRAATPWAGAKTFGACYGQC
ncbi:hypothetical protein X727_19825 [Mesorhizobium sp. L103C119B0]|uniref:hypothetical protein n=1 Tax=Mesorhizobium sp. L103C119B0 TaxID=1287085 RepID=UPI0003D0156E|nr:hypothetical protein [Mesorhizobium sp. L103C119B0]ESZ68847.1 hypothetical protein X727_19825 [Mesorhizobium sp. L103C119B0]